MKQIVKDFNEAKQRADAHIAELWRAAEPAIIFGKEAAMAMGVTDNTIVSGGRVIEIRKKRKAAVAHEIPVVATNKDQEAAESILKGFLDSDEPVDAEVTKDTIYLSEQDVITVLRRGIAAGRIFAREERI